MAATTKTLTPTNETISIPAFTDKPDNRLQTDSTSKLADAVNALSEQIGTLKTATIFVGVSSLDTLKSKLQTLADGMTVEENKLVKFYANFSSGNFVQGRDYKGYLMVYQKNSNTATRYSIFFDSDLGKCVAVGYYDGAWTVTDIG